MSLAKYIFIVGGVLITVSLGIAALLTVAFFSREVNYGEVNYDIKSGFFFQPDVNPEEKLISFTDGDYGNWTIFYETLNNFLESTDATEENVIDCSWNWYPEDNDVCRVYKIDLGSACSQEHYFGYREGKPCIILYPLMKEDWVPEYYNEDEILRKIPKNVRTYIKHTRDNSDPDEFARTMATVWVSCEGENKMDKRHLGTPKYFPYPGFQGFYFPQRWNVHGYSAPLVALHLPRLQKHVLISVKCRMWAKNIPDGESVIRFKIRID